jgi:hypothetical protein
MEFALPPAWRNFPQNPSFFYATLREDKKNEQLLCVSYKNLKTNAYFERERL